ncbi:NAAT1 protein, partial [Acromyrmex charruanus]
MSCVAFSIGLGNIWRFPYTVYENDGGAFLILYILVLFIVGKSFYYIEMITTGEQAKNGSRSSADPYFRKYVLNEMGIEDGLGLSSWKLVLALLASWIFVYVVIGKSVKSQKTCRDCTNVTSLDLCTSLMADTTIFEIFDNLVHENDNIIPQFLVTLFFLMLFVLNINLINMFKPSADWGPKDLKKYNKWRDFKHSKKISRVWAKK